MATEFKDTRSTSKSVGNVTVKHSKGIMVDNGVEKEYNTVTLTRNRYPSDAADTVIKIKVNGDVARAILEAEKERL